MVDLLASNLDGFFFSRQDTELVDDSSRYGGQLIKSLLQADGGRHLKFCTDRKTEIKERMTETLKGNTKLEKGLKQCPHMDQFRYEFMFTKTG